MQFSFPAALLLGMSLATSAKADTGPDCSKILPDTQSTPQKRDTHVLDLVRVRDIGKPEDDRWELPPMTLSPDGRTVSFLIMQADPARNSFCRALVTLELRVGAEPRILDQGGEAILVTFDAMRGLVWPTGFHKMITPRWSPDGKQIAYLRRDNGRTRAWVVDADGGNPHQAASLIDDIDQVDWSRDGKRLIIASRPGIAAGDRAIEAEGLRGHLYDWRSMPAASARPFTPGPVPYIFAAVDPDTGTVSEASKAEQLLLPEALDTSVFHPVQIKSVSAGGWKVSIRQTNPSIFPSPEQMEIEAPTGTTIVCKADPCAKNVVEGWWQEKSGRLLFMRREGWANSLHALYSWRPGDIAARRFFVTSDALMHCLPEAESSLVCINDSSQRLGQIVRIDIKSGTKSVIFDANPELGAMRLGSVARLNWKTAAGVESFGDLVLPPSHKPGQKHPLVVVQYRTQGYLRGGTGDDYPIFALAARGFAVLSFDKPPEYALARKDIVWPDWLTAAKEDINNWNERRNILESLLAGIDLAVARGSVDGDRIGITGLSDGSTTAQFAIVNTNRFKAASVSSCCEDPHTWLLLAGGAYSSMRQQTGYPPVSDSRPNFWKDFSISPNVDRIDVPLLMQMSDREYMTGLEAYWSLREHHKPAEIYVFPDEYHYKWKAAHKLAVYERNIDWFDFWLQGYKDPAADKKQQYIRWDQLKREWEEAKAKR